MPPWLAITLGICAVALTAISALLKAGVWAGSLNGRPPLANGHLAQHTAVMAKLDAIHADTTRLREMGHDIINAISGVQVVGELWKDDLRRR